MPNSAALVLALTAHFIGDYYLQWQSLAEKKNRYLPTLLLHALLYALPFGLTAFFVALPWWVWLILVGSHLLIDLIKWLIERRSDPAPDQVFLIDQLLHLSIIILLFAFIPQVSHKPAFTTLKADFWRWLSVFVLIGKPANVSFKMLFQRFSLGIKDFEPSPVTPTSTPARTEPKPGAGAWIGILERIFVVIFSAASQYAAFGLLMTAKSVARYEKISKDPAFAEYYLIGTLYSVLFALLAYLLVFQVIWPLPTAIEAAATF